MKPAITRIFSAVATAAAGLALAASASATPLSSLAPLQGRIGCASNLVPSERCARASALDRVFETRELVGSHDGANVYAVASDGFRDSGVVSFARDQTSGGLTPLGCVAESGRDGRCADGNALLGLTSLIISPDGRRAYAVSNRSDALVAFERDPANGDLSQSGCVSRSGEDGCRKGPEILDGPLGLTLSPDGMHAYVATRNAIGADPLGTVSGLLTFGLDPDDGTPRYRSCVAGLAPEDSGCSSVPVLDSATSVAASGDGRHVYATGGGRTSGVFSFRRDSETGGLSLAGCILEPTARDGCVEGRGLRSASSVALSPDGSGAYVAAFDAVTAFARDPATGLLTRRNCFERPVEPVPLSPGCQELDSVAGVDRVLVGATGENLFGTGALGTLTLFARGTRDATIAQAGCVALDFEVGTGCAGTRFLPAPTSIAVSPDNRHVYAGSQNGVEVLGSGVAISARARRLSPRGVVTVRVSCPVAEPGGCRSTLRLHLSRRLDRPVGSRTFFAPAGATVTVRVRASRASRAALDRERTAYASATGSYRGGRTTSFQVFGLRPPTRR